MRTPIPRLLTRRRCAAALLAAATPAGAIRPAQAGAPLRIAQVIPLSGAQARAGDDWRNGVEMAVQDINASGGILDAMIEVTTFDSQSGAGGPHTSIQRALDGDPQVLLGPLSGEATLAALTLLRERRIAEITGADSAGLAGPGAPFLLLAGLSQPARMAKLARYLRDSMRVNRVGILWSAPDAGRGGRDGFRSAGQASGLEIVADIGLPANQAEIAGEVGKLARSNAQAVLLAVAPEACSRTLVELRQQVPGLPVFGDSILIARSTLEEAGDAAVGVRAHVALAADAPPLVPFRDRFAARFKQPPGGNAIKGNIAVAMAKAGMERAGRLEPGALAETLRGATVTTRMEPAILLDTSWDANGEPDRVSFLAEVKSSGELAWEILPPLRAER